MKKQIIAKAYWRYLLYVTYLKRYLPIRFLPLPSYVACLLNYNCNLRCQMCFIDFESENSRRELLTPDEYRRLAQQLPSTAVMTFTGGEPMIRKDLFEIFDAVKSHVRFTFVTNGNFLTEDSCRKLLSYAPKNIFGKGLISIGISIQGSEKIHDQITQKKGSWEKTAKGTKMLLKLRKEMKQKFPIIDNRMTLIGLNAPFIKEAYEQSKEFGADIFNIAHFYDWDALTTDIDTNYRNSSGNYEIIDSIDKNKLEKQINNILKKNSGQTDLRFTPNGITRKEWLDYLDRDFNPKHFRCSVPWMQMIISPDGDVITCKAFQSAGNIREKSVKDIWQGTVYEDMRKTLKKVGTFPVCAGCCNLVSAKKI